MKKLKKISIFLAVVTIMLSCEKICDENVSSGDLVKVCVNVSVTGFNITQETRGSVEETDVTHLSFAVFDSEGIKKVYFEQKKDDDDFGNLCFEVKAGTYKLVAVGHSGSDTYGNAVVSSLERVDFPATITNIRETYSAVKEVSIGSQTNNIDIDMERITSQFNVVSSDIKPSDVASIKIYVGDSQKPMYTKYFFNPSTGCMTNFGTDGYYMRSKSVTNDGKIFEMSFDLLLNSSECTLPVKIDVLDDNQGLIRSHDLGLVQFKQNTKTKATGTMFGTNYSPNLNFSTDWETGIEINF